MHNKIPTFNGSTQIRFALYTCGHVSAHIFVEDFHLRLTGRFRSMHRRRRVAQQIFRGAAATLTNCYSNTGMNVEILPVEMETLRELVQYRASYSSCIGDVANFG